MKNTVNVITAGPSAGKSSTIRDLSSRGYRTLPEAARILFDQAISEGKDPAEVRKEDNFHEQVESLDKKIEQNISNETVFLDRSLADNIAYRRMFGNDTETAINSLFLECSNKYDNIFILERIKFKDDEVRVEDEKEAEQIHTQIIKAYNDLGYEPIMIPVKPVDKRSKEIESYL